MAQVTIKIDDNDVLANGSITARPDQSVFFQIDNLTLKMVFENTDGGGDKPDVTSTIESDTLLTLKFVNFTNPLGVSYLADLGFFDGRTLGIMLTVHSVGSEHHTKLINYTLYLGGPVDGK
jgi:hypothetical protein